MANQQKAVAKAPRIPVLEAPRSLGQEPLYNIDNTVRGQFTEVYLVNEKGDLVAMVVNQKKTKETKIGDSLKNYIAALVIGAMGGRGDATGGTVIWAAKNASKMKALDKYTLIAVPEKRGGTLEAPVAVWMEVCKSRGSLVRQSIEKHPIPKRTKSTQLDNEEEDIEVFLLD